MCARFKPRESRLSGSLDVLRGTRKLLYPVGRARSALRCWFWETVVAAIGVPPRPAGTLSCKRVATPPLNPSFSSTNADASVRTDIDLIKYLTNYSLPAIERREHRTPALLDPSQRFTPKTLRTTHDSRPTFFVLCFHTLTNRFSRNSLVFTSIQNPRGCTTPKSPRKEQNNDAANC